MKGSLNDGYHKPFGTKESRKLKECMCNMCKRQRLGLSNIGHETRYSVGRPAPSGRYQGFE